MMMGETQIAYLMLFTAPGMFAVNMLVARWMANEAPPVALAFWRWFGVLLLMLMLRGNQLWQNRHFVLGEWKDLLVLGILGMGICGAFVYIGAETTAASNIGLLYSSSPVLIALMAWKFYNERLTLLQILGGLICLCGVLWIVMRGSFETLINLDFNIGDFMDSHGGGFLGCVRRNPQIPFHRNGNDHSFYCHLSLWHPGSTAFLHLGKFSL